MRCFRHTRLGQIKNRIFQIGGIASFMLWVTLAIWLTSIALTNGREAGFIGASCLALYIFVFGAAISLAIFNQLPEICLDEAGISISFMLGQTRIPWEHVLSLRIRRFPRSRTLVIAKKITPLHYVYGLVYGHTFRPSFIVAMTLENREELIAEIQQHIKARDQN